MRPEITASEFLAAKRNMNLLSTAQFGLLMRAADYQLAAQTFFDFSLEPKETGSGWPLDTNFHMLQMGLGHQRFAATLVFLAFPELRVSRIESRIHQVGGAPTTNAGTSTT